MTRFFVSEQDILSDVVVLTGDNANHAKVLRLKKGEWVLACDGKGKECVCRVEDISADRISLAVETWQESATEPRVHVSVYMAFSKGDKFEHVIQKATELGAFEIVAFPSARCVSKPDEKSLRKKLERWQKIAQSAAEQSGRGRIPQVLVLNSFQDALKRGREADKAILFYENERSVTFHHALSSSSYQSISLFTGPEGGLESNEVAQAKNAGFEICTLGSRILRCETAPLCALSALMYACGEF